MSDIDGPIELNFHRAQNIFDLLSLRAHATPNRIYLYDADRRYSFQDVCDGAVARAARCAAAGVGLGDKVTMVADRSAAAVETIFALALLGANVTLLDASEPFDRSGAMLAGVASTVIVADERLADEFSALGRVVALAADARRDSRADESDLLFAPRASGPNVAFTFYNPGCGGERRAIEFSHQSVIAEHRWLQRKLRLTADDRQLARSALSDMNILRELIWPVIAGCGCCLLTPGKRNHVAAHLDVMARHHVTVIGAVPIMIEALLSQARGGGALATLRRVICTTDLFLGEQYNRFCALLPDAKFYNIYGLSEALYVSSYDNAAGSDGDPSIARAKQTRPMILTDAFDEVGVEQVGRLFVSGLDGAMQQRHASNPGAMHFAARAGAALFDTGRLAYKSIDGAIHLIGRPAQVVSIGR